MQPSHDATGAAFAAAFHVSMVRSKKARGIGAWRLLLCALAALTLVAPASAFDWNITTRPVTVEASYMPNRVQFQIASAVSSFPVGTWFKWNPHGSTAGENQMSNQAILAALYTAISGGRNLVLFGNNADCSVDFFYLQ